MATTKVKKPAAAGKTTRAKATQAAKTKSGAGQAVAERSKDAKPAFGKAAPKRVTPAATSAASKAASTAKKAGSSVKSGAAKVSSAAKAVAAPATKAKVTKTTKSKAGADGSIISSLARTVKATANVAVGAAVATAKGAASLVGGKKSSPTKTGAKAK